MSTENKTIVQGALAELLEKRDVQALAPLLSDDFVHHRPDATSTKEEWLAAMDRALGPLAGMRVEMLNVLAEGDRVMLHSRRRLPGGGPEITVVDILRVDGGLVAEAWEIIEPTDEAAAHFTWWEPAVHRRPA